jgi:hypothetical protein
MLKLLRNVFVALGIGVKKLLAVALFGNLSTDQGGTRGNLGRMTSDTDVSHPIGCHSRALTRGAFRRNRSRPESGGLQPRPRGTFSG